MAEKAKERLQLRGESWREILQLRPQHQPGVDIEPQPSGAVRVTLALPKPRWYVPPITWLFPLRLQRIIELNGLGLRVWTWCDGARTLEEITELFAHQYRLSFHEARANIFTYLKVLAQKGILTLGQ